MLKRQNTRPIAKLSSYRLTPVLIDPLRSLFHHGSFQPPQICVLELKRPDGSTLWVAMERQQTVMWNADRTVVEEASICLSFEQCDQARARSGPVQAAVFYGFYDGRSQRTSLTGRRLDVGAVYLPEDWRGLHLGTFALSEVVRWAQQWPNAAIEPITMIDGDGYVENRSRRNRFYEQFGLRFAYADSERRAGRSLPMRVAELKDSRAWERRVVEHPFLEAFGDQIGRAEAAEQQLAHREKTVRKLSDEIKWAAAHPVRYAWRSLWVLYPYAWFYALVTALLVVSAWRQLH